MSGDPRRLAGRPTITALRMIVEIEEVVPCIWRRLVLRSDITLHEFHILLQAAMGWHNLHRNEFIVGDQGFTDWRTAEDSPRENLSDQKRVLLRALEPQGEVFTYLYDFSDRWRHLIVFEEEMLLAVSTAPGYVIEGERAWGCRPRRAQLQRLDLLAGEGQGCRT
jgi:hypothetical protein